MNEKKEMKIYQVSPLPFQGQKRNFVKQFKKVLAEFEAKHHVNTVIDLFGGSGLLSHTAKRMFPYMRVIYNDYDDFHKRLASIQTTNSLLKDIRGCLDGIPKERRLETSMKYLIISMIKDAEKARKNIDYITLSSSLLFSGQFAKNLQEIERETFYNNVKKADYSADEYLDGLEIVKMDYKDLFNAFKNEKDVLFVLDPPYLSTDTSTYASNNYWKLKDYLNVLNVLTAGRYIYFTSSKSSIIELCDWLSVNYGLSDPFNEAKMDTCDVTINKASKYRDMMLYKYYC